MPMLLGTGCSDVTESLAKITPYWNMVQVSFGSTSPVLSDRREFPLFYRTAAPDSSHNAARLAFIKRFGWETITALSQNEDLYSLAVNDLVTQLESANITCQGTITFAEDDFEDQLKTVKEMDTRIIIGSFSHEVAPKVFCEAHKLGMFGSDYVWILHGSPRERWWLNQTQCTQIHLSAAVEGLILVSSHNSIVGNKSSLSGLTNARFVSSLPKPISPYVHQTYDAVWAIALAMRHAKVNVSTFDYTRTDMAERFSSQLEQLRFLGVSGPVAFNGADRVGISAFYHVQEGAVVRVALYDPFTEVLDFACHGCHNIVWQGSQVPIAKRVFKLRVVTIQPAAFLTIACLASVGITLAIAFLAFNLYFRRLKYIKLSSPRLNNMAVVGCILVYMAVILLGLDHATLPSKAAFPTVCTARVYLLSAGFSLAFGSMFTKTYRVHRIFTRSSSGVVKNKLLQDTQLISLICVLLLIDGLIVTLWVAVDPMQRQLRNLSLEISSTDRSVVYQPQVEVCGSQFTHTWLGALYVYKGLLLIVGVYMAWETRHVKIPALNDSQYIGMSVYSVVITSAIVVVLANLISERATLAFFTITILILFSTTTSLCLLFLPKLHAIFSHPDNTTDPIMHSMGLKIEFNTRRLLMDDRREVYYRVEVQNRVYHRELSALDNEIARLERQLCSDPPTASSSHSSVASRKGELTPLDEAIERLQKAPQGRGKSPSVSGGLPMLLLSVLPPVIPRASWPSAEHCVMPSHGVTFNSEPKLDDTACAKDKHRGSQSHHQYYRDSIQYNESTGKVSVFGKLLTILGNKNSTSNRKTSAASYTGTSGIAAALKAHVGYFAGLVPGTKSGSGSLDSSCNTSRSAINKDKKSVDYYSGDNEHSKYGRFMYRSSRDVGEMPADDDARSQARSVQSLSHRVSFSIQHQHSQPILAFREKVKGSPRFPHRIVPTCSLNALEERKQSISYGNNMDPAFIRRKSQLQALLQKPPITTDNDSDNVVEKCRSLDDNIVVVVQNVDNCDSEDRECCSSDKESEDITEIEERKETLVL